MLRVSWCWSCRCGIVMSRMKTRRFVYILLVAVAFQLAGFWAYYARGAYPLVVRALGAAAFVGLVVGFLALHRRR